MAVTIKPLEDRILVQPLEAEQMTEFIRRSMEIVDIAAQM